MPTVAENPRPRANDHHGIDASHGGQVTVRIGDVAGRDLQLRIGEWKFRWIAHDRGDFVPALQGFIEDARTDVAGSFYPAG